MSSNSPQVVGEQVGLIWKRLGSNRLLLIGLCAVVALLALQLLWPGKHVATPLESSTLVNNQASSLDEKLEQMLEYRQHLEQQLAELLAGIQGVGEVQVMLSFSNGTEAVPAMNVQTSQKTTEERDSGGGTRVTKEDTKSNSLVINNNHELMLLQEKLPAINGVAIVAQGAEEAAIRLELTRVVQTICNVPAHLVQVMPGK